VPTPYVRHSTDCTCCDFGHLRFNIIIWARGPGGRGGGGTRAWGAVPPPPRPCAPWPPKIQTFCGFPLLRFKLFLPDFRFRFFSQMFHEFSISIALAPPTSTAPGFAFFHLWGPGAWAGILGCFRQKARHFFIFSDT
jgi:hypothetical protein